MQHDLTPSSARQATLVFYWQLRRQRYSLKILEFPGIVSNFALWSRPLIAAILFIFSFQNAQSAQIWFAVRGPDTHPVGAADWDALFRPTPEWNAVASRINVFGMTVGYVLKATDQELTTKTANLQEHHIALSLALQSIARTDADPCGHQEGYGHESDHARAAAKLHRLGIKLQYLQLDEPLWFGHYSPDPASCRFNLAELTRRVGVNVRKYVALFPDLTLGDIEPVPGLLLQKDWQPTTKAFYRDLATFTGRPVRFLHTDVAWRTPGWPESLKIARTFAHDSDLRFGVIYNGDGQDKTDAAWVADAISHFVRLESRADRIPDNALFQTWDRHPTHALPETSNDTLSHVMASYLRPRTDLTLHRTSNTVRGQLTTKPDLPVASAKVVLVRKGLNLDQPLPTHVDSGTVPAGARSAIIGVRINTECFCRGYNDISIGAITYSEENGVALERYDLAKAVLPRARRPLGGISIDIETVGDQRMVRIRVLPDQHFGINSPPFAVTPGRTFKFEVPLGSVSATGLYGAVILIWLDKHEKGIGRAITTLSPEDNATEIAATKTGEDGKFSLVPPTTAGRSVLSVKVIGSEHLRGAEKSAD